MACGWRKVDYWHEITVFSFYMDYIIVHLFDIGAMLFNLIASIISKYRVRVPLRVLGVRTILPICILAIGIQSLHNSCSHDTARQTQQAHSEDCMLLLKFIIPFDAFSLGIARNSQLLCAVWSSTGRS